MQRQSSFFWVSDERSENWNEANNEEDIEDEDYANDEIMDHEPGDTYHIPLMKRQKRRCGNWQKYCYGSSNVETIHTIRFQVVVWYVGGVDVVLGRVQMMFRVTLFWNDTSGEADEKRLQPKRRVWTMQGRQQCVEQELGEVYRRTLDVPPVSILNVVDFDSIGEPEVTMMREDTRLMRWSCMYSATLFQENMRVDKFPHDRHCITLKLGVLAERRSGRRWDKNIWKLALATEADSQGSTRIPHGFIVHDARIPDFVHDSEGLEFAFVPLNFGIDRDAHNDQCLQVSLNVRRDSGHYDKNIMPLMGLLNIVAISCIPRCFDSSSASTDLMLGIAFVEIGIRLSVDSRLPSVAYQIKFQRILNLCFYLLLFLVLESNMVFFLVMKQGWSVSTTDYIDFAAALIALIDTAYILLLYYGDVDILQQDHHTHQTSDFYWLD